MNLLIVSIAALSWVILSCGSSTEEKPKSTVPTTPTDIKEFISAKCDMCHFTDRIYNKKRAPMQWLTLIKRMRLKNTNWISEEEAEKITQYLVENYSTEE
jgi:hypothetical protein